MIISTTTFPLGDCSTWTNFDDVLISYNDFITSFITRGGLYNKFNIFWSIKFFQKDKDNLSSYYAGDIDIFKSDLDGILLKIKEQGI